eukprot:g585.t1
MTIRRHQTLSWMLISLMAGTSVLYAAAESAEKVEESVGFEVILPFVDSPSLEAVISSGLTVVLFVGNHPDRGFRQAAVQISERDQSIIIASSNDADKGLSSRHSVPPGSVAIFRQGTLEKVLRRASASTILNAVFHENDGSQAMAAGDGNEARSSPLEWDSDIESHIDACERQFFVFGLPSRLQQLKKTPQQWWSKSVQGDDSLRAGCLITVDTSVPAHASICKRHGVVVGADGPEFRGSWLPKDAKRRRVFRPATQRGRIASSKSLAEQAADALTAFKEGNFTRQYISSDQHPPEFMPHVAEEHTAHTLTKKIQEEGSKDVILMLYGPIDTCSECRQLKQELFGAINKLGSDRTRFDVVTVDATKNDVFGCDLPHTYPGIFYLQGGEALDEVSPILIEAVEGKDIMASILRIEDVKKDKNEK